MKKLYRSNKDAMAYGVCGGVGEYHSIDPNVIRIALIIAVFTGVLAPPLLFGYVAGCIIVPEEPFSQSDNQDTE